MKPLLSFVQSRKPVEWGLECVSTCVGVVIVAADEFVVNVRGGPGTVPTAASVAVVPTHATAYLHGCQPVCAQVLIVSVGGVGVVSSGGSRGWCR